MKRHILFTLALFIAPITVYAVAGVTLINQSTVMAAGGFPYVISQPGSYKLSGNLIVPSGSTAIVISKSNVTIDLNGFSITAAAPVSPISLGITTLDSTSTGITIRGGDIRGFGDPIEPRFDTSGFPSYWQLEDLVLESSVGVGGSAPLDLGSFSRVWHVTAPFSSIQVTCPSVVAETTAIRTGVSFVFPGTGSCAFASNATLF